MLSAEKDAGLQGHMVWIHPDSLLYRRSWGQSSKTHKTSENTKSTYGETYWEWFFSELILREAAIAAFPLLIKWRSFACISDLCPTMLGWKHILLYKYRSSGSSLSEISYCYSQCSPISASDFLDRNTCTYMPQCRLRKPAVVGSLASHIKKTPKFTNDTSSASRRCGTSGLCALQLVWIYAVGADGISASEQSS